MQTLDEWNAWHNRATTELYSTQKTHTTKEWIDERMMERQDLTWPLGTTCALDLGTGLEMTTGRLTEPGSPGFCSGRASTVFCSLGSALSERQRSFGLFSCDDERSESVETDSARGKSLKMEWEWEITAGMKGHWEIEWGNTDANGGSTL